MAQRFSVTDVQQEPPPEEPKGPTRFSVEEIQPEPSHTQTGAPPPPTFLTRAMGVGKEILSGFDPRTSTGRGNIAGGLGAAAATALVPELTIPLGIGKALTLATPLVGAYLGGAAESGGESVASGAPPSLASMHEAGKGQATNEALGQVGGAAFKAVGRRFAASRISESISKRLDAALEAVEPTLQRMRGKVSPGQAGRAFDATAQGPAKAVKDQLGEAVGAAAETGPAIATQPLKDRLAELSEQITPMASHQAMPSVPGYSPAQLTALAAKNPSMSAALATLPADHPLPAALSAVEHALGDADEISFADAHKIKRLLDDAVNWESPAKKQVQQITKGFRQTLRSAMSSHQPYEQATAAYKTVADLFADAGVSKLHQAIEKDPGAVVSKIKWRNPASASLIKEVTDLGGTSQGQGAWHAVRSAWTQENLIAKGATGMANEIDKIEASNAGQEFVRAMYSSTPEGAQQWTNLKAIASALRSAEGNVRAFAKTDLARAPEPSGMVRDAMLSLFPHHTIGKVGAVSRFLFGKGTSGAEMLEWASKSQSRTEFLVKHVLTGPKPGLALADFIRWFEGSGQAPDRPVPSQSAPPKPSSLATQAR